MKSGGQNKTMAFTLVKVFTAKLYVFEIYIDMGQRIGRRAVGND